MSTRTVPNDVHYSFSRLSEVDECAYQYYLEYIEEVDTCGSAFAENGNLVHDLLDKWAKGELDASQLAAEYERRYPDEVVTYWPKVFGNDVGTSTYEKCLAYLQYFNGFGNLKVIATEQEFETEIAGRKFIGFIDMIAEDKDTGELVIVDHKSKSWSAFHKNEKHMYRQQYLYSKWVYETYGKFPDKVAFNLFKESKYVDKQFNESEYNEAISWATKQIKRIESMDYIGWLDTKEKPDFFCQYLCGVRLDCPLSKEK